MQTKKAMPFLFVALLFAAGCRNASGDGKEEPTERAPAQIVELRHRVLPAAKAETPAETETVETAAIGRVAPDFELPAYHNGEFTEVKLSDLRGKWVLVCFYPGDFTFV